MSHFSAMLARYANFQMLLETLKAMGVPDKEILIHRDTHGVHQGYGELLKPRPAQSSRWTRGSTQNQCTVIVTETGMRALGRAATQGINNSHQLGINTGQSAELGFRDCGCTENPGLVMDTDPYESGGHFVGWFTATYQLCVTRDAGFEASTLQQDDEGNFKVLMRQKPASKGRNVARALAGLIRR